MLFWKEKSNTSGGRIIPGEHSELQNAVVVKACQSLRPINENVESKKHSISCTGLGPGLGPEGAARLYGGALSNNFFEEVLTRSLKGRPGKSFREVTVTQGLSTGHSRRKCLWRKVRSSKLILSEGKHTVSTISFKLELKLLRYETPEKWIY